jgi:hypothetical protein
MSVLVVLLTAGACGRAKPQASPADAGTSGAGGNAPSDGAVSEAGPDHPRDGGAAGADAVSLTATLVQTITLPGTPTVSTYNAATKKAYFACQDAAMASVGVAVVDNATNAVVATIMLTGPVTGLAANAATKTVYASENDQIDVIDGATDKVTATVKTPDGALIEGLAVDETRNLIYAVATKDPTSGLYVLDGASNTMRFIRGVLLNPKGSPPVAVDPAMQLVFVLGADSNGSGLIAAFDAVSGTPQRLAQSNDSQVSASASGVVALGGGKAAALLLGPNVLKGLGQPDVQLPAGFTPTGIAAAPATSGGQNVIVVGFGADGGSQVLVVDAVTGLPSPFSLGLGGRALSTTVAAGVLTAAPILGGTELYVDELDPKSAPPTGPAETLKVDLSSAAGQH